MTDPDVLRALDIYLDAAPRSGANAIDVGPFTVFSPRGPWGYYARPAVHRSNGHLFTADEVHAVRATQRSLGLGESIEWVHDVDPSLATACDAAGLDVVKRPLLVLDPSNEDSPADDTASAFAFQILGADDPLLPVSRAVANVGFGNGGTAIGPAGAAERDAVVDDTAATAWTAGRIASGVTIVVAALDANGDMVGVGSAQPVIDARGNISAAELTGIAVLPTHRRRGVGAVLTSALTVACGERGVETILLSAQDDDVARVYERVGFRRVATFAEAAPRPT